MNGISFERNRYSIFVKLLFILRFIGDFSILSMQRVSMS